MTKPFPSDLEIAQAATLEPITEIAAENGISADRLEPYGKYVAKVLLDETTNAETARKRGSKYIVVTAVTPHPRSAKVKPLPPYRWPRASHRPDARRCSPCVSPPWAPPSVLRVVQLAVATLRSCPWRS